MYKCLATGWIERYGDDGTYCAEGGCKNCIWSQEDEEEDGE